MLAGLAARGGGRDGAERAQDHRHGYGGASPDEHGHLHPPQGTSDRDGPRSRFFPAKVPTHGWLVEPVGISCRRAHGYTAEVSRSAASTVTHLLRALAFVLAAWSLVPTGQAAASNPNAKPVVVFAAASLKTALDDIAAEWQRESGRVVRVSYAGTSALARQVEQGAPADVFVSADRDWMDYLAQRGLVTRPRALLANRLVLVAPADSQVALKLGPGAPLVDALGDGRLAVANVDSVPAGRYAKLALDSLGLWPQVSRRLVQSTDVRAALRLVARGEAPLGIVYATDAHAEPLVRIVDIFDQGTHPTILYMAAVVSESSNPDAAAFLQFLGAAPARRIFEREGFTVVASGRP